MCSLWGRIRNLYTVYRPRYSVHCWFSFTCPFPTIRSPTTHSTITNLHIFLPLSHSFPSALLLLQMFSPTARKSNVCAHRQVRRTCCRPNDSTLCTPSDKSRQSAWPQTELNSPPDVLRCKERLAMHMLFRTPVRTSVCPSASRLRVQSLGGSQFLVSHLALYTGCGNNVYHLH